MEVGDYVRFYDRDWTEIGQITGYVEDNDLGSDSNGKNNNI